MALYLFGPLIVSCFRVVIQKNPIPQSLLFHIHRSRNLRCPTYFEPKRHRVDFVALQLRSETIISSSLRYFPAGSCQIKWNKTLSVSLGRWQYYRLSFNILISQMVTNLQFLWLLVLWHDLRHFDYPRIPLQPLASFQATVEHLASNHVIKTIHRIWPLLSPIFKFDLYVEELKITWWGISTWWIATRALSRKNLNGTGTVYHIRTWKNVSYT